MLKDFFLFHSNFSLSGFTLQTFQFLNNVRVGITLQIPAGLFFFKSFYTWDLFIFKDVGPLFLLLLFLQMAKSSVDRDRHIVLTLILLRIFLSTTYFNLQIFLVCILCANFTSKDGKVQCQHYNFKTCCTGCLLAFKVPQTLVNLSSFCSPIAYHVVS